jgi:outer membrane lipoprotein-sorting protein
MKTLGMGILSLIAFLSVGSVKAQTADDVISKYVNALGGKDLITGIKTLYEEGSMQFGGTDMPSTTYIVNGKAFKSVVEFNGQEIIQVVTADKGGWMINPAMGQTTATAMPEEQTKIFKMSMDVGGPLLNYAAKGNKVELVGKDTSGAVISYKLKMTTKDGFTVMIFIDSKTYYLVKTIADVPGQGESKTTFSDHRKTDYGLVVPFSAEISNPQFSLVITQKKVEVNKTIDPAIFDMPK